MRRLLLLIAFVAVCTSTVSAASIGVPKRDVSRLGPLAWPVRVSANGRYFVDQKDRPVFWLGTTQWELFRGYTLEDAQLILDKSKDKGFVFVQTMLVGVGDGSRANMYGQKPWLDDNPLTPNEVYFRNVDAVVQAARERDLILYLMPYHQTCRKRITMDNARPWAKWLAQRYKEVPNIVWSLIPEAKPEFVPILRELAAGLREGDGGAHLITVEPDPSPYSSSFIHGEAWLDFNSIQTWKGIELIYSMVTHDYNLQPVKPVLMAEGAYEQGSEYGFDVSPLWVRRQAYYSYLAGGHHAYGHNDSWRILPTWKQALDAPGARQMGLLRRVFEARPQWWRLVPDQSLFAAGGQTQGKMLHLAARHPEGKWAMVYLADPAEFSVNLAGLEGPRVSALWINPATGESGAIESYANTGVQSFTTPAGWEDSLLILESARAAAPGAGQKLYVSPSGDDANPGTAEKPWRSLKKAAEAVKPGDTVIVRDGVYTAAAGEECVVTVRRGGTADQPIVFRAEHKWGAVVDGRDNATKLGWNLGREARYVTIEGFEIRNLSACGIDSNAGTDHLTVKGCHIHHIGNIETTTRYGLDGIFDNADTSYHVYEGNVFHHIGRTGPSSVLFNLDHGIYTCGKHHTIVNNVFYHMNAGWGVQVAGYKTVDDLLISNNTFAFGNKRGHIVLWQPCHNVLIQNNIFYKPAVPNAIAFVSAELANVVLRNNLVFGGGLKDDNDHEACLVSGTIQDRDPLLVGPERGDFHLKAGSPALGAGIGDRAPGLDMDGKARDEKRCDLGAARLEWVPKRDVSRLGSQYRLQAEDSD